MFLPDEDMKDIEEDRKHCIDPRFQGTNFFYDTNKIYIIKDDSAEEWTEEAANADLVRIKNDVEGIYQPK